ncbi:outer membrane protein [Aquibium carbonis]|nr:outer membrane beta-barrel protein [Aquibium carbonis]
MRSRKITAAIMFAMASSTAYAADQIVYAPPAAYNWTGFHVGVGAGLGGVSHDAGASIYDYDTGGLIQVGPIDLFSVGGMLDLGGDGALGTIEAGYDHQIGERFVIGIQGDYTWSNFKAGGGLGADVCYENPDGPDNCDIGEIDDSIGLNYSLTAKSSWSILGRAGYVANPGALTYVLGGFTRTKLEGDLTLNSGLGGSTTIAAYDYERDGWTFGGGIEAPVTGAMSLKMEYRRTQWENDTNIPFTETGGISTWDDAVVQSMRGVLSWRFGGDNAAQQAAVDAIPAVNWTGFYVGAAGGFTTARHNAGLDLYDYTTGGLIQVGPVDIFSIGGDLDFGGEGMVGRLEAGYDFQVGQRFVVGGFADYSFSNTKSQVGLFGDYCVEGFPIPGDDDCDNGVVTASGDLTYTLKTGDSWSIGGRAGVLVNPQTLFYGLGAYTRQSLNADLTLNTGFAPIGSQEVLSYDFKRDGWTFGLGVETKLTDRLSTKLEYRNTQWNESEIILGDAEVGLRRLEDSTVQNFTVGLSWKFN